MEKVEAAAARLSGGTGGALQCNCVWQSVKAVCALMGGVETSDVTEAIQGFHAVCQQTQQSIVNEFDLCLQNKNYIFCYNSQMS